MITSSISVVLTGVFGASVAADYEDIMERAGCDRAARTQKVVGIRSLGANGEAYTSPRPSDEDDNNRCDRCGKKIKRFSIKYNKFS